MNRNDEAREATLQELRAAGYVPTACRSGGGGWKIKCDGLPPIIVSGTSSDVHAINQARRTVRRIIAQNSR